MAVNGFFTVVIGLLALFVIGMVAYSLVRSWQRPYPARDSGFARLAGADAVFHDRIAAAYLATRPPYRLDNIYQKAGPGYHLYSYDVYPAGGRAYSVLAIVDDRLALPHFSIATQAGPGDAAGSLGKGLPANLPAAASESPVAFPGCPSFAAGYLATGGDAAEVRRLLSQPVLDWLAALRHEPGMAQVAVWGAGPLLVWGWDEATFNSPDPTANLQTSLDRLARLHELFVAAADIRS
jgi:hypothetical protein